jgi:hypothetical protein
VRVGHINLAKSFNGCGDHFVRLLEALDDRGVEQYVVVRSQALAKRLDLLEKATVGPTARSAVMAYCLMPAVDVVHVHDPAYGQAGLLLTLTRSIPFVLTRRGKSPGKNPLAKAVFSRASGVVFLGDADVDKHLRLYRHAMAKWRAGVVSI